MSEATTLWDCSNCGKALISGDSCPKCGSRRSDGVFASAQANTTAQSNGPVFLVNPQHRAFAEGRSDQLTPWDSPDRVKLLACGYGLGASAGVAFIALILTGGKSLSTEPMRIFLSNGPYLILAIGALLTVFGLVAVGWYVYTQPAREKRCALAADGQRVRGVITGCDGTWNKKGWGKSSSWNYEVNVFYSFAYDKVVHKEWMQIYRNELGTSRPLFTFSNNLGTDTSQSNWNLPPPGTPVTVLVVDESNFIVL